MAHSFHPLSFILKRGITLVEMVISSALLCLMSVAVAYTIIYGLRINRVEMISLHLGDLGRKFGGKIEGEVKTSQLILESNNGNKITLTIPNPGGGTRTAVFYFQDNDSNPNTILDNTLMYDSDINDTKPAVVLLSNISPLTGQKIFSYPTAAQTLDVNFRLGYAGSTSPKGDRWHEFVIINYSLVPRN